MRSNSNSNSNTGSSTYDTASGGGRLDPSCSSTRPALGRIFSICDCDRVLLQQHPAVCIPIKRDALLYLHLLCSQQQHHALRGIYTPVALLIMQEQSCMLCMYNTCCSALHGCLMYNTYVLYGVTYTNTGSPVLSCFALALEP